MSSTINAIVRLGLLDVQSTYISMCRYKFNCLERVIRAIKKLTDDDISKPRKRKASKLVIQPSSKKPNAEVGFSCDTEPPKLRGRRKYPCKICGYAVSVAVKSASTKMNCCEFFVHDECWLNGSIDPSKLPCCKLIASNLQKDRMATIPCAKKRESEVVAPADAPIICRYCRCELSLDNTRNLNQYRWTRETG